MKKLLSILLVICMVATLVSCGDGGKTHPDARI